MINSDTVGTFAIARALWRRAPIWRLFVFAAALLTLLFALYPPGNPRIAQLAAAEDQSTANYKPTPSQRPAPVDAAKPPIGARTATGEKTMPPTPQLRSPPASVPNTATLSMVMPQTGPSSNEAGLDDAILGHVYTGSVAVDGYVVPLPPGDWSNLANSTISLPTAAGDSHFLGHIRGKRLVGAIRLFAVRSREKPGEGFNEVKSCTDVNPGRTFVSIDGEMSPTGHQACWTIRSYYTTPLLQWADRAMKLSPLDRSAAGDMAAKGVTYPQDFIAVTFTRTETWGLLEVMYLFSPEAEGISSNPVLAVGESDWTPANIIRYPEKIAYIEKMKAWGGSF